MENNYASCLTDCELDGKTIKTTIQRRRRKRQSSSNKHPETNKENVFHHRQLKERGEGNMCGTKFYDVLLHVNETFLP